MTPKRKQVQDYILKLMDTMDPSGKNTKRYKNFFDNMSDKDFDEYMNNIKNKKDVLTFYSANVTDKVDIHNLTKAADMVGYKIFERIRMWDRPTQTYYLTPCKYMVVQLPIRRVSQFLDHKLSVAESDKRIDMLSGQVTKPDQAASISQVEVQALYARGLENTITELIKYRGGDVVAFAEYKRELEEQGSTTIGRETGSVTRSGVALDQLFAGCHLETNISGV